MAGKFSNKVTIPSMKGMALVSILISNYSFSACNGFVQGMNEDYQIEISDGYCQDAEMHIYETNKSSSVLRKFPFMGECKMLESELETRCYTDGQCYTANVVSGFKCHEEGRSVLAGATYQ